MAEHAPLLQTQFLVLQSYFTVLTKLLQHLRAAQGTVHRQRLRARQQVRTVLICYELIQKQRNAGSRVAVLRAKVQVCPEKDAGRIEIVIKKSIGYFSFTAIIYYSNLIAE